MVCASDALKIATEVTPTGFFKFASNNLRADGEAFEAVGILHQLESEIGLLSWQRVGELVNAFPCRR
jgi:hypothetical protein